MLKSESIDSALAPSPTGKLFGQPLLSLSPDGSIPRPVLAMLENLLHEGIWLKGIFRVNPKASAVRELREKLDSGETVDYSQVTAHVTASLLKEFLRKLPDCVLLSEKFNAWMSLLDETNESRKLSKAKQ